MSAITIFREIILKQIITEDAKTLTRQQLQDQMKELTSEHKAFEDEKNKMLTEFSLKGADSAQLSKIRQQYDAEAAQFHLRRDELRLSMEAVEQLVIGEERMIGSVEGPYEIKVGDNLEQAVKAEIVLKDGVVVEIRQ